VYHHEINERARKGIYFVNTEASEDDLDAMFTHFEQLDALRARLDLAQDEELFSRQSETPVQSDEMKGALARLRDQLNQAIQHFDNQRKLIADDQGIEAKLNLNVQVSEEAAAFLQSSLNDILPEKYVVNNIWSSQQGRLIEDVLRKIDREVAVRGGIKDLVDIAPLLKGQSAEAFRDDYEKSVFDCKVQSCLSEDGMKHPYFSCKDEQHDVGRVYDILTLKVKAVAEHEIFRELVKKDDLDEFTGKIKEICAEAIKDTVDIEALEQLDELLDAMHDYKVPERSSRGRSQDIERGKSELELRNLKDRYRELKDAFLSTRDYEAKSDTDKQFDALEAKFIGRARGDKDAKYLEELREIRGRYFDAIDQGTLNEEQKTEFSAALQNVIDTFDDGRVKRKSRADFLSDLNNRLTSMLNKQPGPNRNAQ
jgi:hypothetical protein